MGVSMCAHLVRAGHEVVVTNRTRSKADPLVEAGARWADDPAEAAAGAEVVFTMVGYPTDVRSVLLGDRGAIAACAAGTVLVDMTTSDPALAVEVAAVAAARDLHVLDAPVSGGDIGARNGSLSIMVGGAPEVLEAVRPLLELLGTTIVHQGDHGAGQRTKLANLVLVAGTMVAVCEALVYAHRSGLDVEQVLASVTNGAAGSWALSNLAPRAVAGDFAPGFMVDHLVKDLGLALAEAERSKIVLPGLAFAHQLYVALQARGRGRDGTQSLVHAVASLSGADWP